MSIKYMISIHRSRDKKYDDYHRRPVSSTSRGLPPNTAQQRVYPEGRYDTYGNHRERFVYIYTGIKIFFILMSLMSLKIRYPPDHKRERYDGYNRPYHRERDHRDRDIKRR